MSSEKRSISAPVDLFAKADARMKQLNYAKFSDYIQALIRADTVSKDHAQMHEQPAEYKTNSPSTAAAEDIDDKTFEEGLSKLAASQEAHEQQSHSKVHSTGKRKRPAAPPAKRAPKQ